MSRLIQLVFASLVMLSVFRATGESQGFAYVFAVLIVIYLLPFMEMLIEFGVKWLSNAFQLKRAGNSKS